eukprot:7447184-Pyramimonas_sp.AAC.1
MPNWVCGTHADGPSVAAGGAPYGSTKRCSECTGRMRTVAVGLSVGFPMRPRSVVLRVRDARGRSHWDPRWVSDGTTERVKCVLQR